MNIDKVMKKEVSPPETITYKCVRDAYYDELQTFVDKILPDKRKAREIIENNFERIRVGVGKFDSMEEIKGNLYILIMQEVNIYNEHLQEQFNLAKEKYFNQLVFFLSFFVPNVKAKYIATRTFDCMRQEYFNYDEEKLTEAYIKVGSLKMCLADLESDTHGDHEKVFNHHH